MVCLVFDVACQHFIILCLCFLINLTVFYAFYIPSLPRLNLIILCQTLVFCNTLFVNTYLIIIISSYICPSPMFANSTHYILALFGHLNNRESSNILSYKYSLMSNMWSGGTLACPMYPVSTKYSKTNSNTDYTCTLDVSAIF